MLSNHRYRGVSWIVLLTMVFSFQPWVAMAGSSSGPASPATRQYTTIPSSTPAARSAAPNLDTKQILTTQTVITPLPLPTLTPMNYDQLREAAVKAELYALDAQYSYNLAAADFALQSSNIKSATQKAGYAGLLHPPLGTPVTGPRWKGFDEVSKLKVRDSIIVTDNGINVQPCNQILGITLSSGGRSQYKTSNGEVFASYNAARDYVLKADLLKNLKIGNTGVISKGMVGDAYYACLDIKEMSVDLDFSKTLIDKIALNDPITWQPVINEYFIAAAQYQEAAQTWQVAEAKLSDLIAKMILKAEASDPKLEGLAIDAYGFWIATKLRYHYMSGHAKSWLPSETAIFGKLQIQKIFQDYSNGKIDTGAYRTSLYDLFNSAVGPAPLLRLDRAFGFAAAYAASLKSQPTLTERVAQAAKVAADKKAAAEKAASSKPANSSIWNLINTTTSGTSTNPSQGFNKGPSQTTALSASNQDQLQVPVLPPWDPMVSALSSRLTEVLFILAVPVLDRTKLYGVTPSWLFITNTAYPMDNYFFALKDQSKSAVVKNGGFDIYDKASGWHKMQIEWKTPSKRTPQDFINNKYPQLAKTMTYPADGSCPHVKMGNPYTGSKQVWDLFDECQAYLSQYRIADSYLAKDPAYKVLSQSTKLQDERLNEKIYYWSDKEQKNISDVPVSTVIPKFLMEVTNAFGINAAAMLSIHVKYPHIVQKADKSGNLLLDLRKWKNDAYDFSNYTEKAFQAEKAAGYPYVKSAAHVTNFSSIAFLFNPVSVGFGSCSIYETLLSPYNTQLGYSCIDYVRPLLEIYKPSKKTSTLFRNLKRLNQWVADQIIPNANAEDIGITKSDDGGSGSGGGAAAIIIQMALDFFGYGSGGGGGSGGSSGAKSATEIAKQNDAAAKQEQQKQTQESVAEAKQIETGQKAIEKTLEGIQQDVNDVLKKLLGLPSIDWKEFTASNPDSQAMKGSTLINNAQPSSVEADTLSKGDFSVMKTLNDRSITAPIDYNGKTYFPKEVNGVSQSQYVPFGGATWYAKDVSVTYVSPDGSKITEVDSFLYTDIKGKDGQETTVSQGVYKIVIMEGADTGNATTILHDLYVKDPDGNIVIMPNGSKAAVKSETLDETFGGGETKDTDPQAANALQDQIDEWVKKHPQ